MDPILALLNNIILKKLPDINSAIQNAIRSGGLDPMHSVASGTEDFGKIDLGFCDASANASYSIENLQGLSSFEITRLQIVSGGADPNDPSRINGDIVLEAVLHSQIAAHLGGQFQAKCGFLHPTVGIGGTVTATQVSGGATGSFSAGLSGTQICLQSIHVQNLTINYGDASASIDGLGIFNVFLSPLTNFILGIFKGQIRALLGQVLNPVINNMIAGQLPQCGSL